MNQVAKMPRDTAKQQLVSTNLQPTNLLFHHNALNSGANMAGTGKHAGGKKITGHISEQHKHNLDKYTWAQEARISFSKIPVGFNSKEQITSSKMQPMGKKVGGVNWPNSKLQSDFCIGVAELRTRSAANRSQNICGNADRHCNGCKSETSFISCLWPLGSFYWCLPREGKKRANTNVCLSHLPAADRHDCTKHILLGAVRTPCVFELAWSVTCCSIDLPLPQPCDKAAPLLHRKNSWLNKLKSSSVPGCRQVDEFI